MPAAALFLIFAVVAGRVALLTLLEASSLPAHSSRLVYPVIGLYDCGLLLLIAEAWHRLRGRFGAAPPWSATGIG